MSLVTKRTAIATLFIYISLFSFHGLDFNKTISKSNSFDKRFVCFNELNASLFTTAKISPLGDLCFVKSVQVFEKSDKFSNAAKFKSYVLHNDLCFNRPLICYKFPLSEHTEEG